jgi:hypothetical protein
MDALTNWPWQSKFPRVTEVHRTRGDSLQGEELKVPISQLKGAQTQADPTATTFAQAERKAIIDALKDATGQISGVVALPSGWA